jgi:hypothetical protein
LLFGLSIGSALSGVLVEEVGWRAAVVASIAAAGVVALVALLYAHTLVRRPATA